jgi:chemotaxis protein MotA
VLALKLILKVMAAPEIGRNILKSEVGRIIKWAYSVQKNGIQALESEAKKAAKGDKFVKFGLDMVISGYTGEEIRGILDNTIETTYHRNCVLVVILKYMSNAAPAFGMIGTLVGLIIMLASMGGDPASLGAGLAVALLTTLYGVIFARMIFTPIATKLQQREDIVRFRNYLVAEGLVLLADNKNPRFIQDRMNSYLDPAIHFDIDKMKK